MADIFKLTNMSDGDAVLLSPLTTGLERPDMPFREFNILKEGNLAIYQYDIWRTYSFMVNNISLNDYTYIKLWWQGGTKLKFYYDFVDNPGSYVTVRIINNICPLSMMFPYWEQLFEGEITLRECSEA